jgi:hypothetical protein
MKTRNKINATQYNEKEELLSRIERLEYECDEYKKKYKELKIALNSEICSLSNYEHSRVRIKTQNSRIEQQQSKMLAGESRLNGINQDSTLHDSKVKYRQNARLSLSQLNPLESVALNGLIQDFGLADTIDFNASINFPAFNGTKKVEEGQYKEPLKGDEEEVDWEQGLRLLKSILLRTSPL